jgi:hypothetical protein
MRKRVVAEAVALGQLASRDFGVRFDIAAEQKERGTHAFLRPRRGVLSASTASTRSVPSASGLPGHDRAAVAANGMLAAIAAMARMRNMDRPQCMIPKSGNRFSDQIMHLSCSCKMPRQLTVSSAGRQACAHNSFTLFADSPLTLKP